MKSDTVELKDVNILIEKRENENDFESKLQSFVEPSGWNTTITEHGSTIQDAFMKLMKSYYASQGEFYDKYKSNKLSFRLKLLDNGRFLIYVPNTSFRAEHDILDSAFKDLIRQLENWGTLKF
jgi:hypothetical protein